jgi:AcrR family transcriptional regulator
LNTWSLQLYMPSASDRIPVSQSTELSFSMGQTTSKSARNRDALISAAARLFWQSGYRGTSIAHIAEAAGIPVGNVFYYFRTKADVAQAVASGFVADTQDMIDEIAAASADPRKRLQLLAHRLAASQRVRLAHGCPVAAAVREFRGDAAAASLCAAEVFTLIAGFVSAETGRTGMRPALALAAGRAAVAEWQGGIVLGHALSDAAVIAESARRLSRLLGVQETH